MMKNLAICAHVFGLVFSYEPACLAEVGCSTDEGTMFEAVTESQVETFVDMEMTLANTDLLQTKAQKKTQVVPGPNNQALQEALDTFVRNGDMEQFIGNLDNLDHNHEDSYLVQTDLAPARSTHEDNHAYYLLQTDLAPARSTHEASADETLFGFSEHLEQEYVQMIGSGHSLGSVPEVKLPSGATVKGFAMPGPILNQSFQLDHFDMNAVVQAYGGIKYATASRWEPPVQHTAAEDEVIDGTKLGPQCSQSKMTHGVLAGSEDCLFLNIYSPMGTTSSDKKPVLVWVHGGNLVFGSANQYHGLLNWLATEGDIVVVAPNYRLNAFGFFNAPGHEMKANFGNRDQIMSLQWIQTNIAAFGGDPNSVTIMGQSGGARSVSVLYMSPMAKGLFHKAIADSPGALDANYFQSVEKAGASMGKMCMEAAGCAGPGALECMRNLTDVEVNAACSVYTEPDNYLSMAGYYMSGYDDEVLPHSIRDPLCRGTSPANSDKPMLSGALTSEWSFFDYGGALTNSPSTAPNMVRRFLMEHLLFYKQAPEALKTTMYNAIINSPLFMHTKCNGAGCDKMSNPKAVEMASLQYGLGVLFPLSGGGTGSRYRYSLNIDLARSALGSGHCGDLCLLFSGDPWTLPFQKGPCGDGAHQDEWRSLGKTMREYWYTFARNGVPSAQNSAEWKPTVLGTRSPLMRMELGKAPAMAMQAPSGAASEKALSFLGCV